MNTVELLEAKETAERRAIEAKKAAASAKATAEYHQALKVGNSLEQPPEIIERWVADIPITLSQMKKNVEDRKKAKQLMEQVNALSTPENDEEAVKAANEHHRYLKEDAKWELDNQLRAAALAIGDAQRFQKAMIKERAKLAQEVAEFGAENPVAFL